MNLQSNVSPKVVIHCQYVYGIGHFVRSIELARGLSNKFDVFILNGGEIIPGFKVPEFVKIIQLPGIYKEENSATLTPVDESLSIDECFLKRNKVIQEVVNEIIPDIIISEHFPFGLLFENEVISLIKMAKQLNPRLRTISSVRDLIESTNGSKRDDYVCKLLNEWYDLILVHGDERIAPLSNSFPKIDQIHIPILHTGYIVRTIPKSEKQQQIPSILVSVGGGRLGSELLNEIIDCHLSLREKIRHKLILFSGAFERDFNILQDKANAVKSDDIEIQVFNSDRYLNCLSEASLVISLGGYNSIIESISAKKPMLIYQREFLGSNEEQRLRIKFFESTSLIKVIYPKDLIKDRLIDLILNQLKLENIPTVEINTKGAENSTDGLVNLLSTDFCKND